jgi:hypothetical protein
MRQRKANEPEAAVSEGEHAPLITLTQSSTKPLQFRGVLIAEANSYNPNIIIWHELALYRRIEGSYILRLQVRKKLPGTEDNVHIFEGDTLEKIMDAIERYMPEYDVSSAPDGTVNAKPLNAEDALTAAVLRQDIQQVRRHYDALAGDFLFALNSLAQD